MSRPARHQHLEAGEVGPRARVVVDDLVMVGEVEGAAQEDATSTLQTTIQNS